MVRVADGLLIRRSIVHVLQHRPHTTLAAKGYCGTTVLYMSDWNVQ
jgi:hypothetical protein